MRLFLKVIPALILWGVFVYVIFYVPYPESLTQASIWQILAFFAPLFLALTFTLNLFFNFIFSSAAISLGAVFLLLLKALDTLNFVSAALTFAAIWLLLSYFRKAKHKGELTSVKKISRLTSLQRQRK